VGLPRLSRISRPMMSTMAVMLAPDGLCRGFYRIAGPRAIGAGSQKTQGS
jgi:hypothetical protein